MKKYYLANAFSLSMIDMSNYQLDIQEITPEDVKSAYQVGNSVNSHVGHADTARVFESILNDGYKEKDGGVYMPIAVNRESLKLNFLDILFVGQYIGPRLPEGATTLPEGATVKWFKIQIL